MLASEAANYICCSFLEREAHPGAICLTCIEWETYLLAVQNSQGREKSGRGLAGWLMAGWLGWPRRGREEAQKCQGGRPAAGSRGRPWAAVGSRGRPRAAVGGRKGPTGSPAQTPSFTIELVNRW